MCLSVCPGAQSYRSCPWDGGIEPCPALASPIGAAHGMGGQCPARLWHLHMSRVTCRRLHPQDRLISCPPEAQLQRNWCAPDTEAPSCGPDTSPVFWERMCQDGSFRAAQGHLHICAGLLGKTRNKPTSRLPGTKMASKTAHPSVPKRR